ncbi:MAG: RsmD family RNA methyltransferase [Spirochaetaceae bacterium]|jgi:16S rRNA (guanine(966)-N(2))-methyltransferase RsmD|nr:RsmD family RNA methyltransferase [Spirochaetaceae bacterium]
MRITGGRLCGRKVLFPPSGAVRPAMDRMRESLFAILGDLDGKSFLDLFSGSGVVALEAVSRGASPVEAVERDALKSKTLIQNAAIALPQRINCRFMACELYVKRAKRKFDVIFCDPPFPYAYKNELIRDIAASVLMGHKSGGAGETEAGGKSLLILHYPREEQISYPKNLLEETGRKEYGRSNLIFLKSLL